METGPVFSNQDFYSMIFGSSPVVQAVLVLLILLSVFSWAITFAKYFQLKKAGSDSEEFGAIFWETRNFSRIDDSCERLSASPLVSLFKSGYRELGHVLEESNQGNPVDLDAGLNLVERALKRAELSEAIKLERGTTFLATVASSAPFIGLFGTVWGIMNAFHGLSNNQATTIQAVAPGISEALVATAVGLAAAIPAAVAYNYFAVAVRHFRESMDKFSAEFVDLARAHLG